MKSITEQLTVLARRYEERLQAIRVTITALGEEDRMKAMVALPGKLRTAVRQRVAGATDGLLLIEPAGDLLTAFTDVLANHPEKRIRSRQILDDLQAKGHTVSDYHVKKMLHGANYRSHGRGHQARWVLRKTRATTAPAVAEVVARSQSAAPLKERGAIKSIMLAAFPKTGAILTKEEITSVTPGTTMQVAATIGALVRRGYLKRKSGDRFMRTAYTNGDGAGAASV